MYKAVGTVLGGGGGGGGGGGARKKTFCAAKPLNFYITLTYKKDTILFISISVISKIH